MALANATLRVRFAGTSVRTISDVDSVTQLGN